ncbi:MAG: YciI family protein [Bauldia sp.]|nr:YciI family protein [Bauldia sp.]
MRFMLIVKSNPAVENGPGPSEADLTEMGRFNEEMMQAGIMKGAEGLHPSTRGARVKFDGKKTTVIDGPFTEAKELVAGFWIIDVPSMADAVAWARRVPNADGVQGEIEVRQVFELDDFGPELTPETRAQEERMRAGIEKQSKQSKH